MTNEEVRKYKEFMFNKENVGNCKECPENKGMSTWDGRKPCGQQNCWVKAHCGMLR